MYYLPNIAIICSGVCEILAQLMEKYKIKETRVPVEILDDCSWIEAARFQFYQEVSAQAFESKSVWNSHGIGYDYF